MNTRPTPETDAAIRKTWPADAAALARQLERERDEAREENKVMRVAITEAHNLVRWLVPNSDGLHHRTATAALTKLQPFLKP